MNGNFFKKKEELLLQIIIKLIIADIFEYDKIKNILKAKGNVIFEDKIKDYLKIQII